jgi:hypothetical protein
MSKRLLSSASVTERAIFVTILQVTDSPAAGQHLCELARLRQPTTAPEMRDPVNVLRNAQRLTGVQRIAGFVGGLHLTGGVLEPIIGSTVEAFAAAKVGRVLPAHCTGWRAVHALAQAMPDAFVQPAVGTVISF